MKTAWVYVLIFALFLSLPLAGNRVITAMEEGYTACHHIVIDAGHGGVDGGAVSCTGVYESHINLEIARRLRDLMQLLGMRTVMIREEDISVYTEGNTIAAKKVSDIRQRIQIVNTTPGALLISIHQNYYHDSKYSGAQVFYNPNSKELAQALQESLWQGLNGENRRQCKQASGVYLMDHINCAGILMECGFLSNPQEEMLLRSADYQKKLCSVIATTVSQYLNT